MQKKQRKLRKPEIIREMESGGIVGPSSLDKSRKRMERSHVIMLTNIRHLCKVLWTNCLESKQHQRKETKACFFALLKRKC